MIVFPAKWSLNYRPNTSRLINPSDPQVKAKWDWYILPVFIYTWLKLIVIKIILIILPFTFVYSLLLLLSLCTFLIYFIFFIKSRYSVNYNAPLKKVQRHNFNLTVAVYIFCIFLIFSSYRVRQEDSTDHMTDHLWSKYWIIYSQNRTFMFRRSVVTKNSKNHLNCYC